MGLKIFFLITGCLLLFSSHVVIVSAQEQLPSLTSTPTPVNYTLPYPGILHGHPLYFLKNVRDGLVGFFISDPLKKAAYDLLQADKNLQATVLLIGQKKENAIVMATLEKGYELFANAIRKTEEAEKQGMETQDFVAKLTLANRKHEETILSLIKEAKEDDKKQFIVTLERVKALGKKVKKLDSQ